MKYLLYLIIKSLNNYYYWCGKCRTKTDQYSIILCKNHFVSQIINLNCPEIGLLLYDMHFANRKLGLQKHMFLVHYILWDALLLQKRNVISIKCSIVVSISYHSTYILFLLNLASYLHWSVYIDYNILYISRKL